MHETERDEGTVWEAVEWSGEFPWADSLPDRIAANPDLWLDHIRSITEKEEPARPTIDQRMTTAESGIHELNAALDIILEGRMPE